MSKIYTRKGDDGKTTFCNTRVSKSSIEIRLIGVLDELNSWLGLIKASIHQEFKIDLANERINDIQSNLMTIMGNLSMNTVPNLKIDKVIEIESEIDQMSKYLPKLSNFIIPGSSILEAKIQIVRTITRKSERMLIKYVLLKNLKDEYHMVLKYFNRLSDYLFTLARYIIHNHGQLDPIWKTNIKK